VTRRTLDPFGLVTKAGVWYLVARDRDTVKTFRVQRIARVRVLERRFTRPSTFDVGEYWKGVAAFVGSDEEPYVATFRMSRAALASASIYYKVESRRRVRDRIPHEWIVRIRFPAFGAAMHEALGWNEEAVAIEPPGLCSALAERVRQLAERYPGHARAG
jgi:predicted DNA-binding transcriptional regulator YafY